MPVYDLNCSYTDLTAAFVGESAKTLRGSLTRIEHCVHQLTDEQVWMRPNPQMNAIGNLLLHLRGNIEQWIVAAIENRPAHRNRPAEFAERQPIPKEKLLADLRTGVAAAEAAIASLTSAPQLLAARRVQGFDTNSLAAIFHAAAHFEGHAQEIIAMTRLLLGDRYTFLWTPKTPEQTSGPTQ